MFEFKLPDVGEGIHEGEIVKWHVKSGDVVKEDQLIVEVMTDKATVEITSPKAGRIGSIQAKEGQVAKVGDVIVTIEEGAGGGKPAAHAPAKVEAHHAPAAKEVKEEKTLFDLPKELGGVNPFKKKPTDGAATPTPQPAAARAASTAVSHPAGRPLAAPAVRRRAREMGIDLAQVAGSGPVGRITSEDLQSFGSRGEGPRPSATPSPPVVTATQAMGPVSITPQGPVETMPMKGLRKRIAENMTRSKHIAAHYTYVEEIDATELVKLKDAAADLAHQRGVKLTFLPFIMKAAIAALKAYPIVNSSYDETKQELVFKKYYHIGVAAATEEGLIVPVVKNADKKSIFDIAKEIETLAEKVKNKKAAPDDLSGSTFTITSLGKLGGLLATPIINYPEVAIMGVHAIKEKPVVRQGHVVPGKVMNLSFSFDHRIVDGAIGAQFAATLIRFLEDPKLLLLETA